MATTLYPEPCDPNGPENNCGDSNTIGPFSQTLFMGASIVSFNTKLGFNGDESQLNVTVIEDECDTTTKCYYDGCMRTLTTTQADAFKPPALGSAVHFQYGLFIFNGILKSWKQDFSSSGKTYSVVVADPSQIVKGTTLILQNFTGPVMGTKNIKVPNVINIIGYIEDRAGTCLLDRFASPFLNFSPSLGYDPANGYGNSNSNDGGLSWSQPTNTNLVFSIREALDDLVNLLTIDGATLTHQVNYGGKLQLRSHSYFLDITELPEMTPDFRITGDSISLMDLISQICHAAGYDFFFTLEYTNIHSCTAPSDTSGAINDIAKHIKIRTIRRLANPTPASNVDNNVGTPIEARLGQGTIAEFTDNSSNPSTSLNKGVELRHESTNAILVGGNREDIFDISSSGDGDGITDTIWHYWGLDDNKFLIVGEGKNDDHEFTVDSSNWDVDGLDDTYTIDMKEIRAAQDSYDSWMGYVKQSKPTIYTAIKLDGIMNLDIALGVLTNIDNVRPDGVIDMRDVAAVRAAARRRLEEEAELDLSHLRMYSTIKKFGDMYGKKFYIKADGLCVAATNTNTEEFALKTNWSPSLSGWSDKSLVGGLDNPGLNFFREEDGRIRGFARFADSRGVDISGLSADSFLRKSATSAFVAITVEKIVFLDDGSPRVLISLDNPARQGGIGEDGLKPAVELLVDKLGKDKTKQLAGMVGGSMSMFGFQIAPLTPEQIAMPLLSKDISYGPWSSTDYIDSNFGIIPAKSSYIRDTNFTPWNYGKTSTMNNAGALYVSDRTTRQVSSEFGSLSIVGGPIIQRLGLQLTNNGPEITSIDVNVGANGVTTNYNMRTYTPSFGEQSKRTIDETLRIITEQQAFQQKILNLQGEKISESNERGIEWQKELIRNGRDLRQTPHNFISAETIQDLNDPASQKTVSVAHNAKELLAELGADIDSEYVKKASVEMAGIFRPFSTVPHLTFPSFNSISASESTGINAETLNPLRNGHDIEYVTRGSTYPSDLSITEGGYDLSGDYRSIGLRGPIVITGWGFDLDGKPVPNSSPGAPTDNFADGFLKKSSTWKSGPLDVRWDEERGVWSSVAASGSSTICAFESLDSDLPPLEGDCVDFNRLSVGQGIIVGRNTSDPEKQVSIWSDLQVKEESSEGICKLISTETIEYAHFDKLVVSNGLTLAYSEPFTATIALNFKITDATGCSAFTTSTGDDEDNEPVNIDSLIINPGLSFSRAGCIATIGSDFTIKGITPITHKSLEDQSLSDSVCNVLDGGGDDLRPDTEGVDKEFNPVLKMEFSDEFTIKDLEGSPCDVVVALKEKPATLFYFKAKADFSHADSNVDVEILDTFNGTPLDEEFLLIDEDNETKPSMIIQNPVVENTPGEHFFEGEKNGRGFAVFHEGSCGYTIIQMECPQGDVSTSASDDIIGQVMALEAFSSSTA